MYWLRFMGVANDSWRKGRGSSGNFVNTMEDALKEADSTLKRQIKYFNPNRYSITKGEEKAKRKAINFTSWLGKEKAEELKKLENQYWYKMNWWESKGFKESMKKFNLDAMYKELNWKIK